MTNIDAGKQAPEFSLQGLDSKKYSLGDLLDRGPVVVAFFKISCPVCQYTFPFLQRLYERYAGEGVSFLGVSQDDAAGTERFAKEYGVTFPTVLDEAGYPASNAYGLTTVPAIFLVNPDGSVKVSCVGFSRADLETIAAELADHRRIPGAPVFRKDEIVPDYKPG